MTHTESCDVYMFVTSSPADGGTVVIEFRTFADDVVVASHTMAVGEALELSDNLATAVVALDDITGGI